MTSSAEERGPRQLLAGGQQTRPGSASGTLPDDLLGQAVHRIGTIALVIGAGTLVLGVLGLVVPGWATTNRAGAVRPVATAFAVCGMCAAQFWVVRWAKWSVRLKMRLGQLFFLAVVVEISVFRHWVPYWDTDVARGPSGAALWTVFFMALVPMLPRRALVLGLCATAMEVLVLVWTIWGGNPAPPPKLIGFLIGPTLVAALLGFFVARVLYGMGRTIQRDREMGSYQLVRRLGAGGMGEVWLAKHRMLARPAAIKLIKAEALGSMTPAATRTTLQRFMREAQVTAGLESPHSIQLYDFGTSDDGTFYYVMELLRGMDLETLVRRFGPVPPERVVHFLCQACHSLADAHRAGLIHRDIKPANLYVCVKGLEHDFVKLLDFGLVKVQQVESEDSQLTVQNAICGTPAFMAPEMALAAGGLDARVDLYALGCVAYWLLTGRPVFMGSSNMAVVIAHVQKAPDPVSQHAPFPVPAPLEALIMRCLAKSPDDRPQSATELGLALRATGLAAGWTAELAAAWWAAHGELGSVDAEVAPPPPAPSALQAASTLAPERPSAL